jgi:hypothetical protein
MTSFDRAQQAHDANTEPPESCDHESIDWTTLVPSPWTMDAIHVECSDCCATAFMEIPLDKLEWH